MIPPIVTAMVNASYEATAALRERIHNVKCGPIEGPLQMIEFELDGAKYKGALRGRNRDLLLGFGAEQDKAIALRVLLDGDAEKI